MEFYKSDTFTNLRGYNTCLYLFIFIWEALLMREREGFSMCCFIPQMTSAAVAGPDWIQQQGTPSWSLHGRQESENLHQVLLCTCVHLSIKINPVIINVNGNCTDLLNTIHFKKYLYFKYIWNTTECQCSLTYLHFKRFIYLFESWI